MVECIIDIGVKINDDSLANGLKKEIKYKFQREMGKTKRQPSLCLRYRT